MNLSVADSPLSPLPTIFCAADTTSLDQAMALAALMQRAGCGIKLGLEFFNAQGPQGVADIRTSYTDLPIFLDLKYHDIPNTVAGAMRAIAPLGVDIVNVHATGGVAMMIQARTALHEACQACGTVPPKILGVTLLTSLDEKAASQAGFTAPLREQIVALARLTQEAGLDGVVCSAHEIEAIRAACGSSFMLVVPGIRPDGSDQGDQKRVMTPADAVAKGADHLVIGRPITLQDDPAAEAVKIRRTLPGEQ